jgi:hypothetical protein
LKGCEDTNVDKQNPNEKLQRGSKLNLSPSQKHRKKKFKKIVGRLLFTKQGNNMKSFKMF